MIFQYLVYFKCHHDLQGRAAGIIHQGGTGAGGSHAGLYQVSAEERGEENWLFVFVWRYNFMPGKVSMGWLDLVCHSPRSAGDWELGQEISGRNWSCKAHPHHYT